MSKKKDLGRLKGKVLNMGIGLVEGIIFNLNGNIAITDKNGNFEFPMVKVGTFVMAMDESSVGLNSIAGVPGPYRVTIEPGKETKFEIYLTRAARIQGHLIIQEDEKSGNKNYYPVKEEIDKLIIEASNGTEIFRILTERDGTFNFNDLRPGNWHVKIYANGIPQGYQLDNNQFDFNLASGKVEKLDVIISKKSREVKFQKMFQPTERSVIKVSNSENRQSSDSFQKSTDQKYTEAQLAMILQQEKSLQKETTQISDKKTIKNTERQSNIINKVVPDTKKSIEPSAVFEVPIKPVLDPNVKITIDPEVPDGLNYRVQLGVFSKPVAPAFFKGITPVFGFRISGTDKTKYYAGMFQKSSDAYKALTSVKAAGFKDAFVVAFSGKTPITAADASKLEKQ